MNNLLFIENLRRQQLERKQVMIELIRRSFTQLPLARQVDCFTFKPAPLAGPLIQRPEPLVKSSQSVCVVTETIIEPTCDKLPEFSYMKTQDNTPVVSPDKKRFAKRALKVAAKESAVKKLVGCPRCRTILTKSGNSGTHAFQCDVGLKAVFRSIRRCAIECRADHQTVADLSKSLASECEDPKAVEDMARLITAFSVVSHNGTDLSCTEISADLCILAHKVCYNWNRDANALMIETPAFKRLLRLPAFTEHKILSCFKPHEIECRKSQLAYLN